MSLFEGLAGSDPTTRWAAVPPASGQRCHFCDLQAAVLVAATDGERIYAIPACLGDAATVPGLWSPSPKEPDLYLVAPERPA